MLQRAIMSPKFWIQLSDQHNIKGTKCLLSFIQQNSDQQHQGVDIVDPFSRTSTLSRIKGPNSLDQLTLYPQCVEKSELLHLQGSLDSVYHYVVQQQEIRFSSPSFDQDLLQTLASSSSIKKCVSSLNQWTETALHTLKSAVSPHTIATYGLIDIAQLQSGFQNIVQSTAIDTEKYLNFGHVDSLIKEFAIFSLSTTCRETLLCYPQLTQLASQLMQLVFTYSNVATAIQNEQEQRLLRANLERQEIAFDTASLYTRNAADQQPRSNVFLEPESQESDRNEDFDTFENDEMSSSLEIFLEQTKSQLCTLLYWLANLIAYQKRSSQLQHYEDQNHCNLSESSIVAVQGICAILEAHASKMEKIIEHVVLENINEKLGKSVLRNENMPCYISDDKFNDQHVPNLNSNQREWSKRRQHDPTHLHKDPDLPPSAENIFRSSLGMIVHLVLDLQLATLRTCSVSSAEMQVSQLRKESLAALSCVLRSQHYFDLFILGRVLSLTQCLTQPNSPFTQSIGYECVQKTMKTVVQVLHPYTDSVTAALNRGATFKEKGLFRTAIQIINNCLCLASSSKDYLQHQATKHESLDENSCEHDVNQTFLISPQVDVSDGTQSSIEHTDMVSVSSGYSTRKFNQRKQRQNQQTSQSDAGAFRKKNFPKKERKTTTRTQTNPMLQRQLSAQPTRSTSSGRQRTTIKSSASTASAISKKTNTSYKYRSYHKEMFAPITEPLKSLCGLDVVVDLVRLLSFHSHFQTPTSAKSSDNVSSYPFDANNDRSSWLLFMFHDCDTILATLALQFFAILASHNAGALQYLLGCRHRSDFITSSIRMPFGLTSAQSGYLTSLDVLFSMLYRRDSPACVRNGCLEVLSALAIRMYLPLPRLDRDAVETALTGIGAQDENVHGQMPEISSKRQQEDSNIVGLHSHLTFSQHINHAIAPEAGTLSSKTTVSGCDNKQTILSQPVKYPKSVAKSPLLPVNTESHCEENFQSNNETIYRVPTDRVFFTFRFFASIPALCELTASVEACTIYCTLIHNLFSNHGSHLFEYGTHEVETGVNTILRTSFSCAEHATMSCFDIDESETLDSFLEAAFRLVCTVCDHSSTPYNLRKTVLSELSIWFQRNLEPVSKRLQYLISSRIPTSQEALWRIEANAGNSQAKIQMLDAGLKVAAQQYDGEPHTKNDIPFTKENRRSKFSQFSTSETIIQTLSITYYFAKALILCTKEFHTESVRQELDTQIPEQIMGIIAHCYPTLVALSKAVSAALIPLQTVRLSSNQTGRISAIAELHARVFAECTTLLNVAATLFETTHWLIILEYLQSGYKVTKSACVASNMKQSRVVVADNSATSEKERYHGMFPKSSESEGLLVSSEATAVPFVDYMLKDILASLYALRQIWMDTLDDAHLGVSRSQLYGILCLFCVYVEGLSDSQTLEPIRQLCSSSLNRLRSFHVDSIASNNHSQKGRVRAAVHDTLCLITCCLYHPPACSIDAIIPLAIALGQINVVCEGVREIRELWIRAMTSVVATVAAIDVSQLCQLEDITRRPLKRATNIAVKSSEAALLLDLYKHLAACPKHRSLLHSERVLDSIRDKWLKEALSMDLKRDQESLHHHATDHSKPTAVSTFTIHKEPPPLQMHLCAFLAALTLHPEGRVRVSRLAITDGLISLASEKRHPTISLLAIYTLRNLCYYNSSSIPTSSYVRCFAKTLHRLSPKNQTFKHRWAIKDLDELNFLFKATVELCQDAVIALSKSHPKAMSATLAGLESHLRTVIGHANTATDHARNTMSNNTTIDSDKHLSGKAAATPTASAATTTTGCT